MFKLNLDRLVRLKGKTNLVEYLVTEGKFSRSVARRLADSNAKSWRPSHLERLCVLFKCDPNVLIIYVGNDSNHPAALKEEEKEAVVNFDRLLSTFTAKELELIYKMIKGFREGGMQ